MEVCPLSLLFEGDAKESSGLLSQKQTLFCTYTYTYLRDTMIFKTDDGQPS